MPLIRKQVRPRRLPTSALALAVLALAGTPCGCASAREEHAPGSRSPARSAEDALARRIARERDRPSDKARSAPVPPGVETAALAPIGPADSAARIPFRSAVEALAREEDPLLNVASDLVGAGAMPRAEDADRALRLYVAGRSKRIAGESKAAIADLNESIELNPGPVEPWIELAQAQLDTGDRLSALSSYRTALTRNVANERALVFVGRSMLERREPRAASRLLARAWGAGGPADAGLRRVVAMSLGQAMHQTGQLVAGNEALAMALDLPERFADPTVYREELAAVYRDRAELWRDLADAACRLGSYEQALDAYGRSADYPSFDPGALAPRRVHAAMRLGRPALAASLVLDDIERAEGRVEDRHFRLIEFITRNSDVGGLIADGVAAIEVGLPEAQRAGAAGRLALARASALAEGPARDVLRGRIRQAPTDQDAIEALYGRIDPSRPRELLEETVRLIDAAPLEESRYLAALLRVRPDAATLVDELPGLRSAPEPATAIARAGLLAASGASDSAERELRSAAAAHPEAAALAIALARLLGRDARRGDAVQALASFADSADRNVRFARASVLATMDLHEEALFALRPALEGPEGPTAREALLAAQSSLQLERWAGVERWCRAALTRDAAQEDAYAGLIALYAPNGPLADARRLSEVVRQLRSVMPSSRTLRWLRAQDQLRAGQFDAAERELVGLAEEEPSAAVVEALVGLWIRTSSAGEAEAWLRAKLAQRPGDPPLVAQLARVLAGTSRASEAESMLREALAGRPREQTLQRALEIVLRDHLGRAPEADQMALARLAFAPPSLERALEIADIRLRAGDLLAAVDALLEGVASSREPRADSAARLSQATLKIGLEADTDATLRPRAIELLSAVIDFLPESPVQLHALRLDLLCIGEPDMPAISAALGLASAHHLHAADELALRVVERLVAADRTTEALAIVSRAARRGGQPDDKLVARWFQLALKAYDAPSAADAVRIAVDRGGILRILNRQFESPEKAGAELAYYFASEFSRAPGRSEAQIDRDTELLYRLVLRYDPRHPMANNNLGYRLIERHERVDEAIRMLEIAYDAAPAEPAIVDSLAWARYKLGQLVDEFDAAGALAHEGAVTLLKKAVDLPGGTDDPTILDHLGDALWRQGEREDAIKRWTAARTIAETLLARRPDLAITFKPVLDGLNTKLEAAAGGGAPQVSPMFDEPAPARKEDHAPASQPGPVG